MKVSFQKYRMSLCKKGFLLLSILLILSCSGKKIEGDILIVNGTVFDGQNISPDKTIVVIKDDKIIYLGNKEQESFIAKRVIDAKGLIVSPGFIDPHTHADRELKTPGLSHNKPFLFQGITTVVVGNDGNSFFPTLEYKEKYRTQEIGTNMVLLVGHGTIRKQVMGMSDRKATQTEIAQMQELLQKEMDAGAFGMSTGLFYAPGSYSDIAEIIALARTVAQNNGIYDTHLRDESSYTVGLISAIEEAIEIGRQAQLPIHISHIKCLGVDVWGQSNAIINLIEKARTEGVEVSANQYPYDASATGLKAAAVPRWAESGGKDSLFIRYNDKKLRSAILEETQRNIARRGGPEKLLIVKSEDSTIVGKNLLEVSNSYKTSPSEAVYTALQMGYVRVASFNMNTEDVHNFMKQPWVVTGSDGNTGHPRKYGSFPRKYNKYVKEDKVIDLTTFLRTSTSRTASIFGIPKRGELKKGYYADIVIFDPKTFKDIADYKNAFQISEGLKYSIINGDIIIEKGIYLNKLKGKVLERPE